MKALKAVDKRARSLKQISYFRQTRLRRAETSRAFRQKLLVELGAEETLAASRLGLVEACVSAYVEVTELTGMFTRGYATPERVRQLSLARGQLQRCLRSLGLIDRDEPGEPEDVAAELERIERRIRQPESVHA